MWSRSLAALHSKVHRTAALHGIFTIHSSSVTSLFSLSVHDDLVPKGGISEHGETGGVNLQNVAHLSAHR